MVTAALPEDDTQVPGEGIMEELADKFRLSNGDVDLESDLETPVVPCQDSTMIFPGARFRLS